MLDVHFERETDPETRRTTVTISMRDRQGRACDLILRPSAAAAFAAQAGAVTSSPEDWSSECSLSGELLIHHA